MTWALDLDGVVWLGDREIPGAATAVARLRASGQQVCFVTNNSSVPAADQEAKLAAMGIEARGAVVTSAEVTADLVAPGERVLCVGGPGLAGALAGRGVEVVVDGGAGATGAAGAGDVDAAGELDGAGKFDAVVVGFTRAFGYEGLRRAVAAVAAGARLLASNDDATFPTPTGPIPGAGAILAGIERAAGVRAVVAGKPNPPMAEHLRRRFGPSGTVVGDRPDTDGALARALAWRFALVLSGVTADATGLAPRPDLVAPSLAALADQLGWPPSPSMPQDR